MYPGLLLSLFGIILLFFDKSLLLKIAKYTLYLIIGAIGGNAMTQLDLFMISSEMGLNYAGIYTIASYMALSSIYPGVPLLLFLRRLQQQL